MAQAQGVFAHATHVALLAAVGRPPSNQSTEWSKCG
jgi:hypothetical protein